MEISVIGAGYVGLTIAVGFASLGYKVTVYDKDEGKINFLINGVAPLQEPGLGDLLKKVNNNLEFTHNFDDTISSSQILFIAVNTDFKNGKVRLSNFNRTIKQILRQKNLEDKTVVIKSTVPIGTTENVEKTLKGKFGNKVRVAFNPEFLREGHALQDFLNPDRIVLGVNDKVTKEILLQLYEAINAPKLFVDFKTAEMIKYASNAFLATKISFINEIANLCEIFGADIRKVSDGIGLDKRIGKDFLNAGIGFGGSCLPKDLKTLIYLAKQKKYEAKLLDSVRLVNEEQISRFVKKIEKALRGKPKKIAVWGVSFKGGTDDIRDSPAIKVIKQLIKKGYEISLYDPKALQNAKKELRGNVSYFDNYLEAVSEKSALLVLSDWREFLSFDLDETRRRMKDYYFFDGRNLFNPEEVKSKGFLYFCTG